MPTSFLEGVAKSVKSTFCSGLSAAEKAALFASAVPVPNPYGAIADLVSRAHLYTCGGDPQAIPAPSQPPSFSGGQCAGVSYLYGANMYRNGGTTLVGTPAVWLVGPVESLVWEETGTAWGWRYTDASNTNAFASGLNKNGTNYNWDISIDSIVLQQRNPAGDECGDPVGELPDPVEEIDKDLDPVEYDDPNGNPVTFPQLPIKFFRLCVGLAGVRVPFEIDLGFTKLCGKIGLAPDLNTIVEPSIDFDQCPSQREDLGFNGDTQPEFFEFLPAKGDPVQFGDLDLLGTPNLNFNVDDPPIMGAFISATRNHPTTSKTILLKADTDTAPNIILPRAGTIFFEYLVPTEDGYLSAFSEDIPIKNVDQFIPCPWVHGAVDVHFRKETDWDFSIIPVVRKSCCSACASGDPNSGLDDLDRCRID